MVEYVWSKCKELAVALLSGANRYPQAHGDSDGPARIPDEVWKEFFRKLDAHRGKAGDITVRETIRLITFTDGSWLVMSAPKTYAHVEVTPNRGLIEAKARQWKQTVSVTFYDPVKKEFSTTGSTKNSCYVLRVK